MVIFEVASTNIRGLRSNFFAVAAHLFKHKPAIMALSETQVGADTDPSDFPIPGIHSCRYLCPIEVSRSM